VKECTTCGRTDTPIRVDGNCFRCHVRGIGFSFAGGAFYGRDGFHTTEREYIAEHVGEDNIANGTVERVR
jgi:ribosomal protein L37AE/L43A